MKYIIPPYYERDISNQDYFNRDNLSKNLIRLFSNTSDPLVLTLNGIWGEGKTTFIKMLAKELEKNDRLIPIYYDAFQNDFSSDAFISLAVTIQRAIDKNSNIDNNIINKYKETTVNLSFELAKLTTSAALKIVCGGILGADSLWDWASGHYKKRLEENKKLEIRESKELIGSKYDAYFNKKEIIEEYQSKLTSLFSQNGKNQNKIIIFIDELDRCRPNYAIEVLEKIKHLFSVNNVIFVLAINKDQLVKVIFNAYGVGEDDAAVYLQKFVHVETNIPSMRNIRIGQNKNKLKMFLEDLLKLYEIPDNYIEVNKFTDIINILIATISFTPRSIERILTLYVISMESCSMEKRSRLTYEILFLSILKVEIPDFYKDVISEGRISDTSGKKKSYSITSNFISYLKKGKYFDLKKIEKDQNDSVWIKTIKDAAKVVDIYDLPDEKKVKKEFTDEITLREKRE